MYSLSVNIYIQGIDEPFNTFNHLSIKQSIFDHHVIRLSVQSEHIEDKGYVLPDKSSKLLGRRISVDFQKKGGGTGNRSVGIIIQITHNQQGEVGNEVIITALSPTILMDNGIHTKSYEEADLGSIFGELSKELKNAQVSTEANPKFKEPIPYVVQYGESDYDFLRRLASKYGEWFFFDGEKCVFGIPKVSENVQLGLDNELKDFDLNMGIKPFKNTSTHYLYQEKKQLNSPNSSHLSADLGSLGNQALKSSKSTYSLEKTIQNRAEIQKESELEELVKHRTQGQMADLVLAVGMSDAPDLTIGGIVHPSNEQKKSLGQYMITSLEHHVDSLGKYWNKFEAVPKEIKFPPLNPHVIFPRCEPQVAIVTENSEPLGRIKVRFPWQESNESTPWIRVIQAHAGQERGSFVLPEVDDEVMVAFEQMNPDRPYVTGSLYHHEVLKEWQDPDNNKKAFKTKAGNLIYISDEVGKETIKIANKEEKNIISMTLEGEGQIFIKTEGEIHMKAKSIKMESETMSIETEQSYELKTDQMKIEATQAELKAANNLDIESTQAKLKASSQLSIDGGGKASVKAGIIELN